MKTPPIVFIHGLAGSKHNFRYLRQYFKNAITFDLPGFASAKKPDAAYDIDFYLTFLKKKIQKKSVLVGHSLGAILAKQFAQKYPKLVSKVFLISYPLQKNSQSLSQVLKKNSMNRFFMNQDLISKIMCYTKSLWKWPILPFAYLFNKKYYLSTKDYFIHSYFAETRSIANTVLKDESKDLQIIKTKSTLIVGEKDQFVNKNLLKNYRHFIIAKMSHNFFNHEKEIAKIIRDGLK